MSPRLRRRLRAVLIVASAALPLYVLGQDSGWRRPLYWWAVVPVATVVWIGALVSLRGDE